MSAIWRGLDAEKYFWRSGREKYFSLDIPFNRTSETKALSFTHRTKVIADGTVRKNNA
jgi:hypothetical protein